MLRACRRIGSWVESLTRPRAGSVLKVVRSCASGRQGKSAVAAGQWWLNAREIARHGSVMSAEIRDIGFLGELGIIESIGRDEDATRMGEQWSFGW